MPRRGKATVRAAYLDAAMQGSRPRWVHENRYVGVRRLAREHS